MEWVSVKIVSIGRNCSFGGLLHLRQLKKLKVCIKNYQIDSQMAMNFRNKSIINSVHIHNILIYCEVCKSETKEGIQVGIIAGKRNCLY